MQEDDAPDFSGGFVLGFVYPADETRTVEFKEVKGSNPIDAIKNKADEYAVAFLNSEGGRVLWGIRDEDHVVVGVSLSLGERDRLGPTLLGKLAEIQPQIDPSRFSLKIHPLGGVGARPDQFVVELRVPAGDRSQVYFTGGRDVFIRVDGAKMKLSTPQFIDLIRHRALESHSTDATKGNSVVASLVRRVRQIFHKHGLLETQWEQFFRLRNAPFSITPAQFRDDDAILAWLEEDRLQWITKTFGIRREWLDGKDSEIHERFYFDKKPLEFFATVSRAADVLHFDDGASAPPEAFFIRWGKDKDWTEKHEDRVFVVVRFPVASLTDEHTVFWYLSDFEPYAWCQQRSNIQLRAWARLLFVNKQIVCYGCDVDSKTGREIFDNQIFLHEVVTSRIRRHIWHPEDHALYRGESVRAKDLDTFPLVVDFLQQRGLPFQETRLGPNG